MVNDSQVTSLAGAVGQVAFAFKMKPLHWWPLFWAFAYLLAAGINFLYNATACWSPFTTPSKRKWKLWLSFGLGVVGAVSIYCIELGGRYFADLINNHIEHSWE